jgi:hypothetical protein
MSTVSIINKIVPFLPAAAHRAFLRFFTPAPGAKFSRSVHADGEEPKGTACVFLWLGDRQRLLEDHPI